ncbi:MAG TPA: hypothetical protein VFT98_23240 [Myxococcota bacterium]|nr:hypothetical protein [Myxococcota bacterium]
MFFLRRLRPLEVSGARVRSLRASLNAPVLSTADLPVGTARSLIIVHREARGGWDATVAVRSERGGEIAYWSFDGELATETDLDVASDAALTFAESLGFVFDDTVIRAGDEAEKQWRAWLKGNAPALSAGNEIPELELTDLANEEAASPAPRIQPSIAQAPASSVPKAAGPEPLARPAPPVKSLSKFRARDAEPAAKGEKSSARQPLARLQLVKRRSPEEERKHLLRRLLTSF